MNSKRKKKDIDLFSEVRQESKLVAVTSANVESNQAMVCVKGAVL